MNTTATQQHQSTYLPILSSQAQGWENILVEQFQHSPGEARCHYQDEHAICLSLASRPVRLLQIKGGKTHTGLVGKGNISITPANVPFFARWDTDDTYLQIRIASRFIQSVAQEALAMNPDQLELRCEFQTRDRLSSELAKCVSRISGTNGITARNVVEASVFNCNIFSRSTPTQL